MSTGLQEISIDDIKEKGLIKDREAFDYIKKEGRPIYIVTGFSSIEKNDQLLEIEIAIRKCERSGLFKPK